MNTYQLVPHKTRDLCWVVELKYTFQIVKFAYREDDQMRNFLGERK